MADDIDDDIDEEIDEEVDEDTDEDTDEETRGESGRQSSRQSGGERPAKKAAARKRPAKKVPGKKVPAKKVAARKAAPKKSPTGQARRSDGDNGRRPKGAQVAGRASDQLLDLIGKEAEGVVGLERTDDGWKVLVEVLELRRVPSTTDVLATYEVRVDTDGDLEGYRRLERYPRGSAKGD